MHWQEAIQLSSIGKAHRENPEKHILYVVDRWGYCIKATTEYEPTTIANDEEWRGFMDWEPIK